MTPPGLPRFLFSLHFFLPRPLTYFYNFYFMQIFIRILHKSFFKSRYIHTRSIVWQNALGTPLFFCATLQLCTHNSLKSYIFSRLALVRFVRSISTFLLIYILLYTYTENFVFEILIKNEIISNEEKKSRYVFVCLRSRQRSRRRSHMRKTLTKRTKENVDEDESKDECKDKAKDEEKKSLSRRKARKQKKRDEK